MKSWKTGLAGILVTGISVAHFIWPTVVTTEVAAAINTLLIAAGLIAAKDSNVTGGTVKQ